MSVYYNEVEPFAAAWLRELMADGLIPRGNVDERSIVDVQASDLAGYTQCHFFCGIAGWPEALRLAGWGDRPVWTGSAPCQPFSSAGKRKGNADERHLWPEFFRLIRECRPDVVFGEQVEGAIRHGWLDGISADLEGEGYAVGHCVLGAHSVGAPHIRQRLYWVADAAIIRLQRLRTVSGGDGEGFGGPSISQRWSSVEPAGSRDAGIEWDGTDEFVFDDSRRLADAGSSSPRHGVRPYGDSPSQRREAAGESSGCGATGGLADSERDSRWTRRLGEQSGSGHATEGDGTSTEPGRCGDSDDGHWSDCRIIQCRDGKARRIPDETQPGVQLVPDGISGGVVPGGPAGQVSLFPLAGKVANRTGLLKGAGNAIVPQAAAEFVKAFMHATRKETPCD